MELPEVTVPTVAIAGSDDRFPVRRILCVGRNYADHAAEMGGDADRDPPFFFTKPADAVVESGAALAMPTRTENLHYEVELVIAIGARGEQVPLADAPSIIFGYAVGIDLTRRDLQFALRSAGLSWDMSKGFDHSAPIGAITRGVPPRSATMALTQNGEPRQSTNIAKLIWSVDEIIAELSTYIVLMPGDLIFTGTPAGVGPIKAGDALHGTLDGAAPVEITFKA